jgi:hypothetical protein
MIIVIIINLYLSMDQQALKNQLHEGKSKDWQCQNKAPGGGRGLRWGGGGVSSKGSDNGKISVIGNVSIIVGELGDVMFNMVASKEGEGGGEGKGELKWMLGGGVGTGMQVMGCTADSSCLALAAMGTGAPAVAWEGPSHGTGTTVRGAV